MADWDIGSYYKNISTLIKRIKYFELPVETTALSEVENILYSKLLSTAVSKFEINAKNITVNLNQKISGTTPDTVCDFVISFDHELSIDDSRNKNLNDLIDVFLFDIQIIGYDHNAEGYHYAWHLDKNIPSSTAKYTHPYYHFQGGGSRIEGKPTGEILLVDFPRIPHPPMDLILGIHFIINNFISSKNYPQKKELLEDDQYQNVIMDSQSLIWDTYFNSFAPACANLDFNFKNVFPLYIHP
jgi:hypothetical protein